MTGDHYRERAAAEFETPWLHLGLTLGQRRACLLAGLALAFTATAAAVHGCRAPDRAHFAAVAVSGGLGLALLAAGFPPEDVFPAPAHLSGPRPDRQPG
jgi:hypothetical protein